MLDRTVPKHAKPTTFPGKKHMPMPLNTNTASHDEIRQRAYELYELRGRLDGFSEQNWLEAEQELLAHK